MTGEEDRSASDIPDPALSASTSSRKVLLQPLSQSARDDLVGMLGTGRLELETKPSRPIHHLLIHGKI